MGGNASVVIPAKAGIQSRWKGWAPAFAGATIILTLLAGCGRKDYPDYPPDAVERPGALQRRGEPVRYY